MVLRHVLSTTEKHAPHPACLTTHCYSHGVDEIETASTYRVCGECFHVYETPHDLVRAWRRATYEHYPKDRLPAPRVERITFCQYCLHDF